MQKTIKTNKTATNLYLLHWQLSESDEGLDDQLAELIDQALILNGYPSASSVGYDNEGEPMIVWSEGFDWTEYTQENHEDFDKPPFVGECFDNYVKALLYPGNKFLSGKELNPGYLWEIAKQFNP